MEPRKGSQPWYRDGLRFACTRCGRCCTNRGDERWVWVEADEVRSIAAWLGLEEAAFRGRWCQETEEGTSLASAGDACAFLTEERLCAIHSVRPRQCRTWPFWPETIRSRKAWEREVLSFCPGAGAGPLHAPEELERLARESEPRAGEQPAPRSRD
jgi:Fe-S-cluster containining protein